MRTQGFWIILIVAVGLSACDSAPTVPASRTAQPASMGTPGPSSVPVVTPTHASGFPATGSGIPFGPFHLPDERFGQTYTFAFRQLTPESAQATLEAARRAGIHLLINLSGARRQFQTSDGAFCLDCWKRWVEAYAGLDLAPYVADGTVIGHLMFDEPQDGNNWNGRPVPFADIEAAAAYSRQLFPGLPAGVCGPPLFLADGAPWTALDFAFAQYTTNKGDFAEWAASQAASAQSQRLGLIFSINMLHGNDRSPVTPEQLRAWGVALAGMPQTCGLLMWKYDESVFETPDMRAAMADVAKAAAGRSPLTCAHQ